ncbi:hypothetical protein [Spirosoma agri]|uniref:Uncharacterized protein n=1 Tax=Spirosoma agri TaxID=1987381 RepID=A0A6M0INK0_9BACT|nr:hypothetical protein [Spirosoma agri]NEU69547.1 hypothetical protein [Spirosoma agri]
MNRLVTLLTVLVLYGCNQKPKTETVTVPATESTTTAVDITPGELVNTYYTILQHTQSGRGSNYEILIDSSNTQVDNIKQAVQMFVVAECTATPCNSVGIWSSESAYTLYKARTDQPAWRKANWPYVAEHYVANYSATVNKLTLQPFLDSEYRRWGGTQQRPTPPSVDL